MPENLMSKAVADGQVFFKLLNLVVSISKLRVKIHKKQREKDRLLQHIGLTTVELCHPERNFDGEQIYGAVGRELTWAERVDSEIADLQGQLQKIKTDFRASAQAQNTTAADQKKS